MAKGEYMAGMLRVVLLDALAKGEIYAYGLSRLLEKDSKLVVRPESLYPVLTRMKDEGLVTCVWNEAENGRPRKIYTITAAGRKLHQQARDQFIKQSRAAVKILSK